MQTVLMQQRLGHSLARTCSSSSSKPATAAAAAVVRRQQRQQHHASGLLLQQYHQQQQQRAVVARVRIDDLDSATQGQAAAAQALQAYMQLEQTGELNSVTAGNLRLKYGIRRGDDGRVQLRKADGTWMQLKLDMEVRGTMLLRNTVDDTIWVLQTERLEQVDLSDDYLMFFMFADGGWEQQMLPIRIADENGESSTLEMGEQQFKDFVGLLKTLQEAEQEAQAEEEGQEEEEEDDGPIDVAAEVAPSNGNKQ